MFLTNFTLRKKVFSIIFQDLFTMFATQFTVYYTVIKHDRHLRTRGKCRKHEPQASVFYISSKMTGVFLVFLASSFDDIDFTRQ